MPSGCGFPSSHRASKSFGDVVKRVLFTGMSGTGKSPLIGEFAARGYKAVDVDADTWSEWVELRRVATESQALHENPRNEKTG